MRMLGSGILGCRRRLGLDMRYDCTDLLEFLRKGELAGVFESMFC